jgi:hypothetical protein
MQLALKQKQFNPYPIAFTKDLVPVQVPRRMEAAKRRRRKRGRAVGGGGGVSSSGGGDSWIH